MHSVRGVELKTGSKLDELEAKSLDKLDSVQQLKYI